MMQFRTFLASISALGLLACGGAQSAGPAPIDNVVGDHDGIDNPAPVPCVPADGAINAHQLWDAARAGTTIGTCTTRTPDAASVVIDDGDHPIADLDQCNITVHVPGVTVSAENPLTVGSTGADLLASYGANDRLECSADADAATWWCGVRLAAQSFDYDPSELFAFPAESATGQLIGTDAVDAVADLASTAFRISLGCD